MTQTDPSHPQMATRCHVQSGHMGTCDVPGPAFLHLCPGLRSTRGEGENLVTLGDYVSTRPDRISAISTVSSSSVPMPSETTSNRPSSSMETGAVASEQAAKDDRRRVVADGRSLWAGGHADAGPAAFRTVTDCDRAARRKGDCRVEAPGHHRPNAYSHKDYRPMATRRPSRDGRMTFASLR